jgi:hypothetical protein
LGDASATLEFVALLARQTAFRERFRRNVLALVQI